MTEISRFWNSPSLGDSSEAPYDAPTEFSEVLLSLVGADRAIQQSGVLLTVLDEYAITPGVGQLTVGSGKAFVWGGWHHNDAVVTITIPTPTVAARYDYIVLRKDWDLQTIRITRIAGTEGGGVPIPESTVGDKWDMPLGYILVNTVGVITLVNDELRLAYPLPNTTYPECKVHRATNQSIPHGGGIVSWSTGTNVKDQIWSSAAPTRLTVKRGGLYRLEVFIYFAFFGGSELGIQPLINGEVYGPPNQAQGFIDSGVGSQILSLNTVVELLKNDYIEVYAYQNSGFALNILTDAHAYFPMPRAKLMFARPLGIV